MSRQRNAVAWTRQSGSPLMTRKVSGASGPSARRAMHLLLEAFDYAEKFNVSPWCFAVELCDLRATGVRNNDLRWLISAHYVDHAQEVRFHTEAERQFDSSGGLSFSDRSCFVLTAAGEKFARLVCGNCEEHTDHTESTSPAGQPLPQREDVVPHYDSERHELLVASCCVKRFRTPAVNQETILMAFEEEEWIARIDDPLRPLAEIDPRRRLHDAIKCLNRRQLHRLIVFRGDGTGQGVLWEFADSPTNGRPGQPK